MTDQRFTQIQTLEISKCERCGESHKFSIKVIFDREMEVLGMSTIKTKSYDLLLKCPKTEKTIVASVPVNLHVNDSIVTVSCENG
jgi:hypothetical protein